MISLSTPPSVLRSPSGKNAAFIELLEDRRKEVVDYTEKYKELV
jgi:hypothetical protein